MVKVKQRAKYGTDAYYGPYPIIAVNNNGTVRLQEGTISDEYNVRNITPYRKHIKCTKVQAN